MIEKFRKIIVIDAEFRASSGELVEPVSFCSKELIGGTETKLIGSSLKLGKCPIDLDENTLIVTFAASAEAAFFAAMKWPIPKNVVDLRIEQKNLDNRSDKSAGTGTDLLSTLARRGMDCISVSEKSAMRELIMNKRTYNTQEEAAILDYNMSDVVATAHLFSDMSLLQQIVYPYSLIRGIYTWLTGLIEHNGIPIDAHIARLIFNNEIDIEYKLISAVDTKYGVFNGHSFSTKQFLEYLERTGTPWIYDDVTKRPLLDKDTFKSMSERSPHIEDLRQLRKTIGQLRLKNYPIGKDSRTRCYSNPFGSLTGRNQPSTSKFIFSAAKPLRFLVKPERGKGIAMIDQSQQEYGIAAALSNDQNMIEAYKSGDPYLAFAKQANAAPLDATKSTHAEVRNMYKLASLAVQYGMGKKSLAAQIRKTELEAGLLLDQHRKTYNRFWEWRERILDFASVNGYLYTSFDWRMRVMPVYNPRSIANFPVQGNGAEILRLAVILGFEAGIKICATIHDAVLIESDVDQIDNDTQKMRRIFSDASGIVLGGFKLESEAKVFKFPDRYQEDGGAMMWNKILTLVNSEVQNDQ